MAFIPKDWQDAPSTATPLSAAALEDLETRLSAYADTVGGGEIVRVYSQPTVAANGVTDDTAAIQAIIDAHASIGVVLDFGDSRHTYLISSLRPKSGHRYAGNGATFLHKPGTTQAIFYHPQSPRVMLHRTRWDGLAFQGEFNDSILERERSGVFATYVHRTAVRDCEFMDFRSAAVHFADAGDVTMTNNVTERCSNGVETEFNAGGVGRNALEVIGSQLAGQDVANYEWEVSGNRVYNEGASQGGAGGIICNMREAPYVRASIHHNWAHACYFAGVGVEGWGRYSSVDHNKTFGCRVGIVAQDTSGGTYDPVLVQQRNVIDHNTVECRHIRPTALSWPDGTATAYGQDVPRAIGIWSNASYTSHDHNIIRATGDGMRVAGARAGVPMLDSAVVGNRVTIANTDAANRPFGVTHTTAKDSTIANNMVRGESGATWMDAYYLQTVENFTWEGNSSRNAGRNAIRIAADTTIAAINGGVHIDPASNEVAAGIELSTTTGVSDLHIGGGIKVKDTRGAGAQMNNGLNAGVGAYPRCSTGEMSLLGWTTNAVNGNLNIAIDHTRLHVEDKGAAPRAFGQATRRRGSHSAVPTTAGWSTGDRIENTTNTPGQPIGWGNISSGNPGTWVPLATIPGMAIAPADQDFTLTYATSRPTQYVSGALTAARAVTLSTTGAYEGVEFTVVRTGAGAFNLNVGTGPLKAMAANTWADFIYDGSAWRLARYGAL